MICNERPGRDGFSHELPKFLNHEHLTNFRQIFGRRPQQRAIISRMPAYCVRVTSVRIVCTHRIGLCSRLTECTHLYGDTVLMLSHAKNRVTVSELF